MEKLNNLDQAPRQLPPEERIYPLTFACRYVMEKKDDLALLETQTFSDLLHLQNHLATLLEHTRQVLQETTGTPIPSQAALQLLEEEKALQTHTASLIAKVTQKGLLFENMTNMLQQTEPLISHLLFRDNLTTAYNRYFFLTHIEDLFQEGQKTFGLSLAFIDIDNFRDFNTRFGHDFGDKILKAIADTIHHHIYHLRQTHLIRMGGDEFILISTQMAFSDFVSLLDQIREAVCHLRDTYPKAPVSISIGAANAQKDTIHHYHPLYLLADQRLYDAKNQGKNQIIT